MLMGTGAHHVVGKVGKVERLAAVMNRKGMTVLHLAPDEEEKGRKVERPEEVQMSLSTTLKMTKRMAHDQARGRERRRSRRREGVLQSQRRRRLKCRRQMKKIPQGRGK